MANKDDSSDYLQIFRYSHRYALCVLLVISMFIHNSYSIAQKCDKTNCLSGDCVNGSCVCDVGWGGPSCNHCNGRVRLTNPEGIVTDGHGNYSEDNKCTWLVDTGQQNSTLRLQFHQFSTECGWDHLYVYDGDSAFSPLVAALSGLIQNKLIADSEFTEIKTQSGKAYLYFYSDAAYNMSGFNISYMVGGCPKHCSGHGDCVNEVCQCHSNYTGETCEIEVCPSNCSGNGLCENDKCQCAVGFTGDDCSLTLDRSTWQRLEVSNISAGRASAAVTIVSGTLYHTGGYTFNRHEHFLSKYDFETQTWTPVYPASTDNPPDRYGHSLDNYQNKLYMYGGVVSGNASRTLWIYDVATNMWTAKRYNETLPVGVAGHTSHVVNGIMYVFFGYSPIYGYKNRIQEYHIGNDTWIVPRTNGALVKGGYGHSSVYDPATQKVYVYGGYHPSGITHYTLTDVMYSFEPSKRLWVLLRQNGRPRYLHSAVIIDGQMIVFGGNTHNDTSISYGAKCYSPDLLTYDINCNEWKTVNAVSLPSYGPRYGHTAATYTTDGAENMYIIGGFNGLMQNNILQFVPGNCSYHQSEEMCVNATQGRTCVWAIDTCKSLSQSYGDGDVNAKQRSCDPTKGREANCPKYTSCPSCLSNSYGCVWCKNNCSASCSSKDSMSIGSTNNVNQCASSSDSPCSVQHKCDACNSYHECFWSNNKCTAYVGKETTTDHSSDYNSSSKHTCRKPCYLYDRCENCTKASCMWCSNQNRCVETNAYVACFVFGQCMEWTTDSSRCPATRCSDLHTCGQCQSNPLCGWCNDPSNTGIGKCMEGGASGPVDPKNKMVKDTALCPAPQWYFTGCPLCQCNGHSTCLNSTGVCDQCQNMTEGSTCESCQDGFYGKPTNGGSCKPCQCNDQADTCNRVTGVCYCRTRGVVNDRCDKCDTQHKYFGDPKTGTCYYNLVTDYQFTFNLSKPEDRYYSQINFMNIPSSSERDVDFKVNCSKNAYLNITVRTRNGKSERLIAGPQKCTYFRAKFEHGDFSFGTAENTTFLVYISGFQTPFWLQISFAKLTKPLNLLQFFAVFFGCFLLLLIIAAVLYKIKHLYDKYRRRQRMMVEMEEMASRPFSSIILEVDRKFDNCVAEKKENTTEVRKRKKIGSKPSQIAMEPLGNQKAAVLSLIVQLPTGDDEWTPNGASGVAVASALVSLGHHRKLSIEHGGKGEKSKFKKYPFTPHSDTCV